MEAIVGGVIGGVVLLVLLAFVIVAVYLLQKNRSSKYTVPATPAVGMYRPMYIVHNYYNINFATCSTFTSLLCQW